MMIYTGLVLTSISTLAVFFNRRNRKELFDDNLDIVIFILSYISLVFAFTIAYLAPSVNILASLNDAENYGSLLSALSNLTSSGKYNPDFSTALIVPLFALLLIWAVIAFLAMGIRDAIVFLSTGYEWQAFKSDECNESKADSIRNNFTDLRRLALIGSTFILIQFILAKGTVLGYQYYKIEASAFDSVEITQLHELCDSSYNITILMDQLRCGTLTKAPELYGNRAEGAFTLTDNQKVFQGELDEGKIMILMAWGDKKMETNQFYVQFEKSRTPPAISPKELTELVNIHLNSFDISTLPRVTEAVTSNEYAKEWEALKAI